MRCVAPRVTPLPAAALRRRGRRASSTALPRASNAAPREPAAPATQQCAAVEALLATVRRADSGAWAHPSLSCRVGDSGRSLFVDRDVPAGTILTVIPRSMCLHAAVSRGDDLFTQGQAAHHDLASQLLSVQAAPAADDAVARVRAAYIAALPARDEARAFPLFWPESALTRLADLGDPGFAANVRSARAAAHVAHAAMAPHASHDDWLWAQAMAQSRMYPGWQTPEEQRANLAPWWLIPVIDIANHAPYVGSGAARERNSFYQCFTLPDLFRLLVGKFERESLAGAVRAVAAAVRRQEPAAALISIRSLAAGDEVLVSYSDGEAKPGGGLMGAYDELMLYGISDTRPPRGAALLGAASADFDAVALRLVACVEEASQMSALPDTASLEQSIAHALPPGVQRWSQIVATPVAIMQRVLDALDVLAAHGQDLAPERAAVLYVRRCMLADAAATLSVFRSQLGDHGVAALRSGVRAGVAAGLAPIADADGAARAAMMAQLIEYALLTPAPTSLPLPRDDPFFRNTIAA